MTFLSENFQSKSVFFTFPHEFCMAFFFTSNPKCQCTAFLPEKDLLGCRGASAPSHRLRLKELTRSALSCFDRNHHERPVQTQEQCSPVSFTCSALG